MNGSDRLLLQDELGQDKLSSLMATIQGQSGYRMVGRIPSPDSSPHSPRDFSKTIYTTQEVFDDQMFAKPEIKFENLTSIEPNDLIFLTPFKIQKTRQPHPMFVLENKLTNYKPIIGLSNFCSRPGGVASEYASKSFVDKDNSGIICIIITRPKGDGTFSNFLAAFATIRIESERIEVGSTILPSQDILNIEVICSKKYTLLGQILWEYIKKLAFDYGIRIIHLDAVYGAIPTYLRWGFDYINWRIDDNTGQKIGLNSENEIPTEDENDDNDTPMRYIVNRYEPSPTPPPGSSKWTPMNLGRSTEIANNTVLYGLFV